ncbi:hypothetical protein SAMN05216374_3084 [Tardiphaga sp. OK246]|jgi:hypothetical protein|uniref:hypothetical protein n=1 Tax=Tardiphaga sp. OK246 TaxID=1855307 RepID=UPI000B62507D|nr:hypothetical protein [Tardiphaga sp. OK246]SNT31123.1 hypothetical protein SAMN05216374_3084 [Tardiphaga sp. OK246]
MTTRILTISALLALAMPALAQQPPEQPKPEVIIGGQSPPPTVRERCVEVEIGGARSFGCLNQTLKRDVEKVNPTLNLPPIDARSGDTKVGVVNLPGVQQQYGQNYGRSVIPYRLPPPIYSSPVSRR